MPATSAFASSRPEYAGPIASRISTCRPPTRAKAGPKPCEISCSSVPAMYPSPLTSAAWSGCIMIFATGTITYCTRASMKFLKKIFFVPFSW